MFVMLRMLPFVSPMLKRELGSTVSPGKTTRNGCTTLGMAVSVQLFFPTGGGITSVPETSRWAVDALDTASITRNIGGGATWGFERKALRQARILRLTSKISVNWPLPCGYGL